MIDQLYNIIINQNKEGYPSLKMLSDLCDEMSSFHQKHTKDVSVMYTKEDGHTPVQYNAIKDTRNYFSEYIREYNFEYDVDSQVVLRQFVSPTLNTLIKLHDAGKINASNDVVSVLRIIKHTVEEIESNPQMIHKMRIAAFLDSIA